MLFDGSAKNHEKANQVISLPGRQFIIPEITLTETCYLFRRSGRNKGHGTILVSSFLERLIKYDPYILCLERRDYIRAREIMNEYADSFLDFVDCCLMALSERLEINQICTFDTRDFEIYRQPNRETLEILPK